ncbi:hypothetical protein ACHAXT_003576 [Thalassiosira profunda]
MGLFGRKSLDHGAWSNPPPPGLVRSLLSDDAASREEVSREGSATSSHTSGRRSGRNADGGQDANDSRESSQVQRLERHLVAKDEELTRLRSTMEAQEAAQARRIGLLERQLEVLVELTSAECVEKGEASLSLMLCKAMGDEDEGAPFENDEASASSADSEESSGKANQGAQTEKNDSAALKELLARARNALAASSNSEESSGTANQGAQSEKDEAAALKELLARVIAERDRLSFRNEELERLVKEYSSTRGDADVFIADVDGSGDCDETSASRAEVGQSEEPEGEKDVPQTEEGECPVSVDQFNSTNEDEIAAVRKQPVEECHEANPQDAPRSILAQRVLYKLSCRDCSLGGSDITYLGSYTSTSSNGRRKLSRALKGHFAQVWDLVEEGMDDGRSVVDDVREFASSALAVHLAEHCIECASKEEAVRWCVANVKVKIEKHEAPSESERKDAESEEAERLSAKSSEEGSGLVLCEV